MMRRPCVAAGAALLIALAVPAATEGQVSVVDLPGSNVKWEIDSRTAMVAEYQGRQALHLRGQSPAALAANTEFTDGTIEFDLATMPGGNFLGLVFRYESPTRHENVYFRLHKSGEWDAVQYAPRLHTTAGIWQLLPEMAGKGVFPPAQWVHVRAEIRGSRLELFVGDSVKPLVVVPRMRGLGAVGRVGIWGRVNDRPEQWTAAISNIQVRPRAAAPLAQPDTTSLPPGTIANWQLAGPYEAPDSAAPPPFPPSSAWKSAPIEEGGLLNISRAVAKPSGGRHVAFARTTLVARAAGTSVLELQYSDDIMVWLNGMPLYRGANGFNGRYPGFLGWMAAPAEQVFVQLRAGSNELVVAVGERAFGWGLKARLVAAAPPVPR